MTPCSESDLIALWIVQKPNSWLALPAIPHRTEVVICFRITTNQYWAKRDLAFFLANLHHNLYKDGLKTVSLASISFMADGFKTIGFAAYKNTSPKWFAALRNMLTLAPAWGLQDTYWGTWPTFNIIMVSDFYINDTLSYYIYMY